MYPTHTDMTVTVTGGTLEENQQMCTAIQKAMKASGFKNVDVEAGSEWSCGNMLDSSLLTHMCVINPDLLDTSVVIQGESQEDLDIHVANIMRSVVPVSAGVPYFI